MKKNNQKGKLPARALFYAIVVSLLIALTSALLISLAYLQRLQQSEQDSNERIINNLKSGIAICMGSGESKIPTHTIDLFGEHRDSVTINKEKWGLFSVGSVAATSWGGIDTSTLRRTMLIGEQPTKDAYPALYLSAQTQPLVLAGNTAIRGTAFVPEAGVRTAIINGKPYVGTSLVYGERRVGTSFLPPLADNKIRSLVSYFTMPSNGGHVGYDSIQHSFLAPTLFLTGARLVLSGKSLKGNIIVQASDEILVPKDCSLEDVMLFAPKIRFEKGFEGSVQAYATEAIEMKPQCKLGYPSVLGLICPEGTPPAPPYISVDSSCLVEGCILAYPFQYMPSPPRVSIGLGSTVTGLVWAKGEVDLRGSVHGSVMCDMFVLATPSSILKNTLLDAVIDRSRLSAVFVAPFINAKNGREAVAKWVE